MKLLTVLISLAAMLWHATGTCQINNKFDPKLAPIDVSVNGRKITHEVGFRTLLPNQIFTIEIAKSQQKRFLEIEGEKLPLAEKFEWRAGKIPQHTSMKITDDKGNTLITLNVFVLAPIESIKNGQLNGYKIGTYPPPYKGLDAYKAPKGFIEVTKDNFDLRISPHFTLGQFICKQEGGYPKYVALRPALIEKLEFLLQEVNELGIRANSFTIMSGFRTPYYNKAIGNVPNSRHLFGGAADIFIDESPADGVMDDINRDGKFDVRDAAYLYAIADKYVTKSKRKELTGGVGQYDKTSSHGPFVHIDVRGTRARWGH